MTNKKKTTHTIPAQYLGAFKAGHRTSAREFIDEELSWDLLNKIKASNFTDKASMDALAYIAKFNNEFHKNFIIDKPLHNLDELTDEENSSGKKLTQKQSLALRENARNRDIMSRENKFLESLDGQTIPKDPENVTLGAKIANNLDHLRPQEETMVELIDAADALLSLKYVKND
jgi:Xaa-Pro aminopeptidase